MTPNFMKSIVLSYTFFNNVLIHWCHENMSSNVILQSVMPWNVMKKNMITIMPPWNCDYKIKWNHML